jgi:hypothetical protein
VQSVPLIHPKPRRHLIVLDSEVQHPALHRDDVDLLLISSDASEHRSAVLRRNRGATGEHGPSGRAWPSR